VRAFLSVLPLLLAGCGDGPRQDPAADQPGWSGPRTAEVMPAGRLDRSHAGTPAPGAWFKDPHDDPASFEDFRGKPLLVNLWATWCAPCVAEMPTLDALAGREGDRLRVLALSEDLDGRAKVETFFAARDFANLEPYLDPQLEIMAALGVSTLPTTILYDSAGRELWRVTGIEDWESERAAALIGEAWRG
jgi:thiol-disulfide isomerase/thioredoxin